MEFEVVFFLGVGSKVIATIPSERTINMQIIEEM